MLEQMAKASEYVALAGEDVARDALCEPKDRLHS
jgi:hypothetical protein